jgi:hypothetical protein
MAIGLGMESSKWAHCVSCICRSSGKPIELDYQFLLRVLSGSKIRDALTVQIERRVGRFAIYMSSTSEKSLTRHRHLRIGLRLIFTRSPIVDDVELKLCAFRVLPGSYLDKWQPIGCAQNLPLEDISSLDTTRPRSFRLLPSPAEISIVLPWRCR